MADLNSDSLRDVDEINKVAILQMQAIKKTMAFRIGEDEKYVKMYSSMYSSMLQNLSEDERNNAEVIEKLKANVAQKAFDAMLRYRQSRMKQMSAAERADALADAEAKKQAEIAKLYEKMQEEIAMETSMLETEEEIAAKKYEIEKKYQDKIMANEKSMTNLRIAAVQAEKARKEEARNGLKADAAALKDTLQDDENPFLDKVKAAKDFLAAHPLNLVVDVETAMKKNEQAQKNYEAISSEKTAENAALQQLIKEQNEILDDPEASEEEKEAARQQIEAAEQQIESNKELIKESAKQANEAAVGVAIAKLEKAISGAYKEATSKAETILNDYMGIIDGRMQGSDKNFKDMSNTITSKLAVSPFVQSTKVLDKLKEAAENGISYNTEQRAFLATISEKIAKTFDAFDANLLRIIRLQQADTTATRLGMEASLTKLFNGMFQDSSYLKNVSDSITGALIDATSQLNHKASAEFEFVVQKWLGALSSLGMSDNSLTQIATGLNYLATGDVTNLANNSALQTMFAMAASNANLEYSEILLNGLNADTTNRLLESMVLYLKDIAENSDNQVVKAAYGDIFSLSMSDMKAISNLTTGEISSLSGTNMSYSDLQQEMDNQMNQLWNRTSIASMLTNVFDNVIYSVASDMTNNPAMFAMQKMLNFMDETKTDIRIPFINAMGFGLDLNASVKDLMQMGVGLGQAFSLTGNILSGLSSGGGTNLDSWGATETTKRGTGLNLKSGSTLGGVSGSIGTYATSGSSSDVKNSTMNSATDDAEDSKKVTNKNSETPENTMDDLMAAIVGVDASSYVLTHNNILEKAYEGSIDAIKVIMAGLTLQEGILKVRDDRLTDIVDAKLIAITTYLAEAANKPVSVTINNIPEVALDKAAMTAAVKSALYDDEGDKTFSPMLKMFKDGTLQIKSVSDAVMVKNNTGEKLQVSNLVW